MKTAIRIIETVLSIPVGGTVKTDDVCRHLRAIGYRITTRTVERDLVKLCGSLGVKRIGRSGWTRTRPIETGDNQTDGKIDVDAPAQMADSYGIQ